MQSFVACETFSDCDRPWLWPCQINMRSSLEWKHKTVTKPWSSFAAYFVGQPWSVARHESIPKPNRIQMNRAAVQQKIFPPIGISTSNQSSESFDVRKLTNEHFDLLRVRTMKQDDIKRSPLYIVQTNLVHPHAPIEGNSTAKKERLSAKWCCKVSIFGQQKHCFGKSWCTSVSSIQLGQRSIVLKPVFCWHFDVSVLKNI